MKRKERWVWGCSYDTWTWSDGERCRAGSKKPVATEAAAERALNRHWNACPSHEGCGQVYKMAKGERFR